MSALLTTRPAARDPLRAAASNQERLFGDEPIGVHEARSPAAAPVRELGSPPAKTPAGPATTVDEEPAAPAVATTLDAAITGLWHRLTGGEAATCPVCDGPMDALHSAGPHAVGGRCRSCGSTLA